MNLPEVRRKGGFSATAAHPHGDTGGARDFVSGPRPRRFRRGRKGLQLRQQPFGTQSLHAGSRAENFPEVRLLLLSPTTRTLFSLDWILVSPDDFQLQFFKSSNRAVELPEGVRSNNFCAKLVVCFGGKPQGHFGRSQFSVAKRLCETSLSLTGAYQLGKTFST